MNGAHDLGGMMGFGAIDPEPDEPLFHADWEKRALALTLAAGMLGRWTIDRSRATRENLGALFYLSHSYYEIWLAALERLLAETGLVSAAELAGGPPEAPKPGLRAPDAARARRSLARGTPYDRPAAAPPRFAPGERVRARMMNPATHTRLPRYVRGRTGLVESVNGAFVFPDSNAHGAGEAPAWCYTVRFSAQELWGPEGDTHSTVSIDAWEAYLEPV